MISYKNDVDSFVIVSSDSDYWGLISSLPDAHFLVMIEREKCGPDMKEALADSGIFYCYLDDFYSGNSEDIKKNALFKEMYRWIDNSVHLNPTERALSVIDEVQTVCEKTEALLLQGMSESEQNLFMDFLIQAGRNITSELHIERKGEEFND